MYTSAVSMLSACSNKILERAFRIACSEVTSTTTSCYIAIHLLLFMTDIFNCWVQKCIRCSLDSAQNV